MKRVRSILFLIPFVWQPTSAGGAADAFRAGASAGPEAVTDTGRPGGRLVVAVRSEPKTLNPSMAADGPSREIIAPMMADLIHINRLSQATEPALATSWTISKDARQYTLTLRRGVRFSDGHPFGADDVLFTFRVLLDEKIHAPHRDLLIVGGKPITVDKIDPDTVQFTLAQPYAAAERLFDSIAILPRHLLERAYDEGTLPRAWPLNTAPGSIAGLGPFRLKAYVPGQHVVLERNPYYWKTDRAGQHLPYLDEIVFLFAGTEDGQVIRFQGGDTHVVQRLNAENFAVLARTGRQDAQVLEDLGPGLEYNFLFFNLNDLSSKPLAKVAASQTWFRDTRFRRAVSLAIDRQALVRLAYQGRAVPLWGHVTDGNKRWVNRTLAHPARSPGHSRELLRAAGFSWRPDGQAVDGSGRAVEFTLAVSSTNAQRVRMATLIQDDLKELGIAAQVVSLEFRALLDRVFQTYDYEACILGLGGGDADPNSEMNVWLSRGSSHLWNLAQGAPQGWEAEIDDLMQRQLVMPDARERKRLYDRVQELVAEHLPIIPLASPHVLVAARREIGNLQPAVLDPTVLWNVDELFFRAPGAAKPR